MMSLRNTTAPGAAPIPPASQGRLAGPGEAANSNEGGAGRLQQLLGHRQILASGKNELGSLRGRGLQLGRRGARLGANRRSAREEERQQRKSVELIGSGEILVEDHIGMIAQPQAPEIHQEKRKVVEH